jgi:hypothetical protein
LGESDVFVQPESGQQGNRKNDAEGRNVGRDGHKPEFQHLVTQHKVVNQEVQNPIQHHVTSATKTVTKELRRHHFSEVWNEFFYFFIEKVDYFGNYLR